MKGVYDALSRRSGVKSVMVKLQNGLVVIETDPAVPVLPAHLWKEIQRVGFVPHEMEIRAEGVVNESSFQIDGRRWPLVAPAPAGKQRVRLKVTDGGADPPIVEFIQ